MPGVVLPSSLPPYIYLLMLLSFLPSLLLSTLHCTLPFLLASFSFIPLFFSLSSPLLSPWLPSLLSLLSSLSFLFPLSLHPCFPPSSPSLPLYSLLCDPPLFLPFVDPGHVNVDVPHVVIWRKKLVQVLHRALELISEEAFTRLLLSFLEGM